MVSFILSGLIVSASSFAVELPLPPANDSAAQQKITEVPVTVAEDSKAKGILLYLPKAISAAHAGKDFVVDYTVVNTLEEKIFFETEPTEFAYTVYSHPEGTRAGSGGSATMGGHSNRYALLRGSDYRTGERMSTCCSYCSRQTRIHLTDSAKAGGTLKLTVYVKGYFAKNGEPFSGQIEVSIPVVD